MKLITFAKREGVATEAVTRFFESGVGSRFANLDTKAFTDSYDDFRTSVAQYANDLFGGDRLALYVSISDLVTALREKGLTSKEYSLKNSFISDDEANLIILKALHRPMSQEELASDVLKCSRNAVNTRVRALQDGIRVGDISVQLELEYGGRLQSTVHPVMLPLNLSEVYALLVTLKQDAASREKADPRGAIVDDLAEKIYSQLTPYAISQIDRSLAEADVHMRGGVVPRFRGDDAKPSRWYFFEKAGVKARVLHAASDNETVEHVGMIVPSLLTRYHEEPHSRPSEDSRSDFASQPRLALKLDDGSLMAIRWSDVIDIQQAE